MAAADLNLDHYAVLGHPVAHSRSPRLHQAFAAQSGQRLDYLAIDVPPEEFEGFWQRGPGRDLAGANITLPLKQRAFELAEQLSDRAQRAGAVNTLHRRTDGVLYGDNTDGIGLIRDLGEKLATGGQRLVSARLLLLGAGGAARGVLGPLLEAKPAELLLANRTPERALQLAAGFDDLGPVSAIALEDLAGCGSFDGIINASAAGHAGAISTLSPTLPGPGCWCYDLSYGTAAEAFLDQARAAGCQRAWDGLGMLVEQGAAAFELWRGVRPETRALKAQISDW